MRSIHSGRPTANPLGSSREGKLKNGADANGERLQSVCDAVNGRGGTWNREGSDRIRARVSMVDCCA